MLLLPRNLFNTTEPEAAATMHVSAFYDLIFRLGPTPPNHQIVNKPMISSAPAIKGCLTLLKPLVLI
jgi:hypothetical protein